MSSSLIHLRQFILLAAFGVLGLYAGAQDKPVEKNKHAGIDLSLVLSVPLGDFSDTHWGGAGIEVSPAIASFNINHDGTLVFTGHAGFSYFVGKKEMVAGYPYRYPGFIIIHTAAGLSALITKDIAVSLRAGPAIGMYNGNTSFNAVAALSLSFNINERTSIGPSINAFKEFGTNALWTGALKANYSIGKKHMHSRGTPRF